MVKWRKTIMITKILCRIGFHSYKWGEINNEAWGVGCDFSQSIVRRFSRDFIVGECKLCGFKNKKYLN